MNLLKNAKENLLQTAVAILAIGAGVYLPTMEVIRTSTSVMLFLSLFAAFGGALLSKALEGEEKTAKRFRDQLRPIIRHLASITKELTSVTRGTDANQITNAESIKLIDQLVPNMIGAMTDLGDVVGEPFDPNTIFQTAQQVENLDKLLSSLSRSSKDGKQQALIEAAKSALANIHPDVYKRVLEKASCPHCHSVNDFMLGQEHPASAAPICGTCKQSFHVHRNKDRSIKTVAPGWNKNFPIKRRDDSFAKVECSCGKSFRSRIDKEKTKIIVCNGCGKQLSIDRSGHVSESSNDHLALNAPENSR